MIESAARKAGLKVARQWSSVSTSDGSKRRASKGTRRAVREDILERKAEAAKREWMTDRDRERAKLLAFDAPDYPDP